MQSGRATAADLAPLVFELTRAIRARHLHPRLDRFLLLFVACVHVVVEEEDTMMFSFFSR